MPFATPFNHYNNKYVYMDFFLYARWFSYAFATTELSVLLREDPTEQQREKSSRARRSVKNGKIYIEMFGWLLVGFGGRWSFISPRAFLDYMFASIEHLMGRFTFNIWIVERNGRVRVN